MAAPRRRKSSRLAEQFTMKKASSAVLLVLVPLAVSSLVILILPDRPPRTTTDDKTLIVLNLKGRGKDEAALALQSRDLSIIGFGNQKHQWYAFPGYEHLLTASTLLPFGNSYRDLIGGVANLPDLPLGKESSLQAVRVLSDHDPAVANDDGMEVLKRALATLKLSKCDAMRVQPIREMIEKGWHSGDVRVAREQLPYIEHLEAMRSSAGR